MKLKILLIVICLILIGIGSCWFVEDTFFMVKQDPIELEGNELQVEVHKLLSSYIKTVDLSEMDLSKPGEHEIVVSEDYLWVHREETYVVITKDVTPPVITLNGEKTICFEVGSEFIDPGVSVSDDSGEECILETSFEGDMNTPGIYRCVYKATDSSGNVSYNNIDVAVGEGLNPDLVNSAYFELPTDYEFYTENYLFDEILFIGDSNIREMSYSHYLNSDNCVSAPALMPPE
ncbi:MAG: DUF5011 domain-containing protein, partial [Erysipelotrichaceae bacterium]|nr:DUF5011 domain-containing protein [Erysipelotrichaceae bacterium]